MMAESVVNMKLAKNENINIMNSKQTPITPKCPHKLPTIYKKPLQRNEITRKRDMKSSTANSDKSPAFYAN